MTVIRVIRPDKVVQIRDRQCAVSAPYRTVPGRDGIEKKSSRAVRYGTVWISRGTVRYAVSDGYTALPCHREKSFDNDFQ